MTRRALTLLLLAACGPRTDPEPPPPPPPLPGHLAASPVEGALPPGGTLFDRIPQQGWPQLPGRAIGLLASQVGPWGAHAGWDPRLHRDGHSFGDGRYLFSSGASAPWVLYFESKQPVGMNHLKSWEVPLPGGAKGTYDADMLHPGVGKAWGLTAPAHLVEVEVNGGRGAASGIHFVATAVEVVDRTTEYPIDPTLALGKARLRWDELVAAQAGAVREQLALAATGAGAPAGHRQTEQPFDGMTATWLPDQRRLRVLYVRWVLQWTKVVTPAPPPSCPPGAPCALDPDIVDYYGHGVELGLVIEFDAAGAVAVDEPHPPRPLHPTSVQQSGLLGDGDRY
jgi:hypothetical protein